MVGKWWCVELGNSEVATVVELAVRKGKAWYTMDPSIPVYYFDFFLFYVFNDLIFLFFSPLFFLTMFVV